jgi:hypothetical protein
MNPSEEFRRHAAECGQMANFLHDKNNRAAWNNIADRYLRCAQWYDSTHAAAQRVKHRSQKKAVTLSGALDS